jgi:hypothetical protein
VILSRVLRWICRAILALSVLAGAWLLGLHLYSVHRLDRARSRYARELGPLPPVDTCDWPATDPRNGAHWYLAAAARVPATTPGFASLIPIVRHPPSTWSYAEVEQTRMVLDALRQPLALAFEANARPICELRAKPARPDEFPEAAPLVRLSRLLLADVGFELRQARPQGALRSIEALRRLALGMEAQPTFAFELLGTRIEARYLQSLHWILGSEGVPTKMLFGLRAELPRESVRVSLARLFAREAPQTSSRFWDLERIPRLYAFCCVDRDSAVLVDGFSDLLSWTRIPYPLAAKACAAEQRRSGNSGEIAWAMIVAYYLDAIGKRQATAAARQLARFALDLRIDAVAQGHYPERLPTPHADEIDPFTGAHVTYARIDQGRAQLYNSAAAAAYHELEPWDNAPILPFDWTLPKPSGGPPRSPWDEKR